MSKVGDGISASHGAWTFGGDVAKSFDQHISKSVPLYSEGHNLICDLSDFFVKDSSVIYEFGCSTGQLIRKLREHNLAKKNARFIGVDVEKEMIEYALSKDELINLEFYNSDVVLMEMEKSDLVVCYYTIQFINPSLRQDLINKIYENLNWGGALILFEKVRGSDARFQDILTMLYNEYKLRLGYSAEDILSKARSLKGILEPFSSQGNIDMLKRAGFSDINTVQKYLCFEGFLAIK
jgi:tRNA (cmo5U34)-methyltransferase